MNKDTNKLKYSDFFMKAQEDENIKMWEEMNKVHIEDIIKQHEKISNKLEEQKQEVEEKLQQAKAAELKKSYKNSFKSPAKVKAEKTKPLSSYSTTYKKSEMFDALYGSIKQKFVDEPGLENQPVLSTLDHLPPTLMHLTSPSIDNGIIIFAYDNKRFCIKKPGAQEVTCFNLKNPKGKIELLEYLKLDLLEHPEIYRHLFRGVYGFTPPPLNTIQEIRIIDGKLKFIFNNPIFEEEPEQDQEENMIPEIMPVWGQVNAPGPQPAYIAQADSFLEQEEDFEEGDFDIDDEE